MKQHMGKRFHSFHLDEFRFQKSHSITRQTHGMVNKLTQNIKFSTIFIDITTALDTDLLFKQNYIIALKYHLI